jgi:hypothetical protein
MRITSLKLFLVKALRASLPVALAGFYQSLRFACIKSSNAIDQKTVSVNAQSFGNVAEKQNRNKIGFVYCRREARFAEWN